MRIKKRLWRLGIFLPLMVLLATLPVLAAISYTADVVVSETDGNSYNMLGMRYGLDVATLETEGYITNTGLDTRVEVGATAYPHMLAEDKLMFADTVGASSSKTYQFTTDNAALSSFDIIPGYGGYVTVSDAAALELGNNFEIEQKGYVDTDAGSDKNLVYKQGAFRTYISGDTDITSAVVGWLSPTSHTGAWTNPTNAYDDNIATYAEVTVSDNSWSSYLYLERTVPSCTAIRFISDRSHTSITILEIDVEKDSSWVSVYDGNPIQAAWHEESFAVGEVTQMRVRYYKTGATAFVKGELYEVDFLGDAVEVIATGVSSGEHTVKVEQGFETGAATLGGWSKRVKLTIDNTDIDGALSDFPILVYLSTSSGRNSEDVSFIFDELQNDASRLKIAVTEDDGITECYVEIEKWDDASEEAWLWVKAPSVASGVDTDLYFYFDSTHGDNNAYVGDTNSAVAENVWDANFKAVYHMADGVDNEHIYDSTGNDNDGTKKAANTPTEAAGDIGEAQDFTAANEEYLYGNPDVAGAGDALTVSILVNPDLAQGYQLFYRSTSGGRWYVGDPSAFVFVRWQKADDAYQTYQLTTTPLGAFRYFNTTTYESGVLKGYHDGALEQTQNPGSHKAWTGNLYLGFAQNIITSYYDGLMDEVRISDIARSAEWIKATKESLWDNLLDFGSEEEVSLAIYIDDVLKDSASVASVPNNANDWVLTQNNVMPYMEFYKHTVGGTLIAWYQPVDIISGTTLPDREGAAQNGIFTWGNNPSGVAIAMSSLLPVGVTVPGEELVTPEVVGEIAPPSGMFFPDEATMGQGTILKPVAEMIADIGDTPEWMVWWWFYGISAIIVLAVTYKFLRHYWMAGVAAVIITGLFFAMGVLPWWFILINSMGVVGAAVMERTPAL